MFNRTLKIIRKEKDSGPFQVPSGLLTTNTGDVHSELLFSSTKTYLIKKIFLKALHLFLD